MKKIFKLMPLALLTLFLVLGLLACGFPVNCKHDEAEWTTTLEPTCVSAGRKELRCKEDNYLVRYEAITQLEHDYETNVLTDAACETDGTVENICKLCEYSLIGSIEALQHDYAPSGTFPTCTDAGEITYTCLRDSSHTYIEHLPVLEHDYEVTVIAATCTEEGLKTYVCKNNESHTYDEVLDILGHNYQITASSATCDNAGDIVFTCANDEAHEYLVHIDALGHDYETSVIAATCLDNGLAESVCKRDATHTKSEVLDALGHDYKANLTSATCDLPGETTYVCAHDETHAYSESVTALGHDYREAFTTATCDLPGETTYVCAHDETHTYSESVTALGHDYRTTSITYATCTTDGIIVYICKNDSSHTFDEVLEAHGHEFGEWEYGAEQSYQRPEYYVRTCVFNAGHKDYDYTCVDIELGVQSENYTVAGMGVWFRLILEEATTIQMGGIQDVSGGVSLSYSASLYTKNHDFLAAVISANQTALGVGQLEAGTYYIRFSTGNNTSRLMIQDFSLIIKDAPDFKLDTTTLLTDVNTMGEWGVLTLEEDTLVYISSINTLIGNSLTAQVYAGGNLKQHLISSRAFATQTLLLTAGVYYVRTYAEFGGTGSANVLLTNMSEILKSAPRIELGESTPASDIVTPTGTWYKLSITETLNVRFLFNLDSAQAIRLYKDDENLTEVLSQQENGGTIHVATISAGEYYVLLYSNSIYDTAGGFTIKDLTADLAAATDYVISTEITANFDSAGKWYKMTLTEKTIVSYSIFASYKLSIGIFNVAADLNTPVYFNNGKLASFDAGEYYIFVVATSSAGVYTFNVFDGSEILDSAAELTLGTKYDITLDVDKVIWLKLEITEDAYVSYTLTGNPDFYLNVFNAEDINKIVGYSTSGRQTLKAGVYYFCVMELNATEQIEGELLIEILENN